MTNFKDEVGRSWGLTQKALSYLHMGNLKEAEACNSKALQANKEVQAAFNDAWFYSNEALLALLSDDENDAYAILKTSMELTNEIDVYPISCFNAELFGWISW